MAEINAKDLTAKTSPASTDSMLLFGTTTNEGAKITVDNLADNILGRLTTKTFANQVGGSSAATLLSQLSTLNSKIKSFDFTNLEPVLSGSTYYLSTTELAEGKILLCATCTRAGWLLEPYYGSSRDGDPNYYVELKVSAPGVQATPNGQYSGKVYYIDY